jgi:hypothetical protein
MCGPSFHVLFFVNSFPLDPNPDPRFQDESGSGPRKAEPIQIHANLDQDTDLYTETVEHLHYLDIKFL